MLNPFLLGTAIDWPYLSECLRIHRAEASQNEWEDRKVRPREKFLLFTLLNDGFALPVSSIEAISVLKELTPVPDSPDHIVGMTQIRGVIYGVVDIKKRLALPSVSQDAAYLLERVAALSFDAELERLLVERIRCRGIGFRSCRLLIDDMREGLISRDISLQTFEKSLLREIELIERTPRILLLSGPGAQAIIVDTVLTVTELTLDDIIQHPQGAASDIPDQMGILGSVFVENQGREFKTLDIRLLLEPVQDECLVSIQKEAQ